MTALTASPKAKGLFQQVWVTNGAGVFQNKSLEMANTENKVRREKQLILYTERGCLLRSHGRHVMSTYRVAMEAMGNVK